MPRKTRKNTLHRLYEKFKLDRYLTAWLVLAMDLVISLLASTVVVFICHFISRQHILDTQFTSMWILAAIACSLAMFLALKTYRAIIRYSTLHDIGMLFLAVLGKDAMLWLFVYAAFYMQDSKPLYLWIPVIDLSVTFAALVFVRSLMNAVYDMIRNRLNVRRSFQQILVYGTGSKAISLVVQLQNSKHYRIAGFITHGKQHNGYTSSGFSVYYFDTEEDLANLVSRYNIDAILFPHYNDAQIERDRLIHYAQKCGIRNLISPSIDNINGDEYLKKPIRAIKIEDLLERPEIEISMDEIVAAFKDKIILVTGAAGSIGSELCRQLANFGIRQLIMFDNAETPLHYLRLEFEDKYPELNFSPIIGDVRIPARLDYVFRKFKPQIVFHAAAYKHVPLMEENPCEAVLVNVAGSRNVADKCIEYDVEKMVMISTDKAVNPTNIMGCTKRLAEIYVQSLGLAVASGKINGKTRFVTTRFGNVLGSNGSVIPRFREQIAAGGPVTVTHPDITRFFMTIPEACRLVMEAATISSGNQICVFDMGESVKIAHLAARMIELAGYEVDKDIKIKYTGLRPGEKLYEEVLATEENTVPTSHDRIRIAMVREYDHETARNTIGELEQMARDVDIIRMVSLMKKSVPEYKSENSRFEQLDK